MLDGMVTVEVVPHGTSRKALSSGRIRRTMIVVPVDNINDDVIDRMSCKQDDKWHMLTDDCGLEFLRPMTMGSVMGGLPPDGDDAWEHEEASIKSAVRNGDVIRASFIVNNDDTGDAWSFNMPKPDMRTVMYILGIG